MVGSGPIGHALTRMPGPAPGPDSFPPVAVAFEEDYGLELEEEIVVEYENHLALADAQVEPLQ